MSNAAQEHVKPRTGLAYLAIIIALSSPLLQAAMRPFLEGNVPYPFDRFLSIWVFWIAAAVALYISVRIEGIPLATFGIMRNTRSLRYRLIEMIAALILSVFVTIVLLLFSNGVRGLLNAPANAVFDPANILPFWVMFPAWVTGSFLEELLFRSYPIERLTMLTGNRWLSAAISVFLFIILHLFGWDWIHVLTVVLPGGLLLTGLYLWRRSLWFVVVIHAVINLPLLFLPLLAPYL